MSAEAARRLALTVAYDGSEFAGFQLQSGPRTVQGVLEQALGTVLRTPVRLNCAGRTDAGVHAVGQVVSFETTATLPPSDRLRHAVNAIMPVTVKITGVHAVPGDFHARFSCRAREYVYLFSCSPAPPVHWKGRALHLRVVPAIETLNQELSLMLGERDWAAFTRVALADQETMRYVDVARLETLESPEDGPPLVRLRLRANAFLHNMIRILVGSLTERILGRLPSSLPEILDSKDRLRAGPTASPEGLYFTRAYYSAEVASSGLPVLADYPVFRRAPLLGGSETI